MRYFSHVFYFHAVFRLSPTVFFQPEKLNVSNPVHGKKVNQKPEWKITVKQKFPINKSVQVKSRCLILSSAWKFVPKLIPKSGE